MNLYIKQTTRADFFSFLHCFSTASLHKLISYPCLATVIIISIVCIYIFFCLQVNCLSITLPFVQGCLHITSHQSRAIKIKYFKKWLYVSSKLNPLIGFTVLLNSCFIHVLQCSSVRLPLHTLFCCAAQAVHISPQSNTSLAWLMPSSTCVIQYVCVLYTRSLLIPLKMHFIYFCTAFLLKFRMSKSTLKSQILLSVVA